MGRIVYTGVFVDAEELAQKLLLTGLPRHILEKEIDNPHVTFQFMPSTNAVDERLFGTPVEIIVAGYGADEENEGVYVGILMDSPEILALYRKIAVPHITLSVSKNGRPVNTCHLEFHPLDEVFSIKGVYKAYTG